MITEKHIPLSINADDDHRLIKANEAINIENCRVALSLDGKDNRVENIPSTLLIPNSYLPNGNNTCIGSTVDVNRKRLIYFIYNNAGSHVVFCYDIPSGNFYKILTNANITGGLNFDLNYSVNREAKVVGDLLIWTDGLNEPRCINIESGIKLNHPSYNTSYDAYNSPIDYETITLIKRPPIYPLVATKNIDNNFTGNFIKDEAFQFVYQYVYKDYQVSALSAYSNLINYNNNINTTPDTFNNVIISVPFAEKIDDYILTINICCKYGNTGKTFIIKTFDKRNELDLAAINNHNSGAAQLSYTFYNNESGIALDAVSSVNNFDSVPLLASTIEVARNRIFLGNVTMGYDTPNTTSLTCSIGYDSSSATYNTTWKRVSYYTYELDNMGSKINETHGGYVIFIILPLGIVTQRCFAWDSEQEAQYQASALPSTINSNTADYITGYGSDYDWLLLLNSWFYSPTGGNYPADIFVEKDPYALLPVDTTIAVSINVTGISKPYAFKSNSSYSLCMNFYDRFRRKCASVVSENTNIIIPDRVLTTSSFPNTIYWSVNNDYRLNEIPTWAYYYQLGITKNKTVGWFVENYARASCYVLKDNNGIYTYEQTTFDTYKNMYAIGINISSLTSIGYGYTFTQGDMCTLYLSDMVNNKYDGEILGIDGNWLLIKLKDIGGLGGGILFSIYTPYKETENVAFYEVGNVYNILNPNTNSRMYSTIYGAISGDVYVLTDSGTSYKYQAMSPNKNMWMYWQRDIGWINYKSYLGQQKIGSAIVFSDTYIQGTQTSGLNKFQPLNIEYVSQDAGDIRMLILSNKLGQQTGSVMLCICNNETFSIYLGETQLVSQTGDAYVAVSNGVIGTINAMKGNFGTKHPESVINYLGDVFWYDVEHGCWTQYASNGVLPINYTLDSYYKKFGLKYSKQNSTSRIISGIDPVRKQLIAAMPSTEYTNYPYQMPSYGSSDEKPAYVSTLNSKFDLYDGFGKMFFMDIDKNKWNYTLAVIDNGELPPYIILGEGQVYISGTLGQSIIPEWLEFIDNSCYSFTNGNLFKNEAGSDYNKFWGYHAPARIAIAANQNSPSAIRDLYNIALESNAIPDYTLAYSDYPNEQITDLTESDYTTKEGVQYASFFRDRLSPNEIGTAEQKMYKGDFIKSVTPKIMIEFQQYVKKLKLNFINIGYDISSGHTIVK